MVLYKTIQDMLKRCKTLFVLFITLISVSMSTYGTEPDKEQNLLKSQSFLQNLPYIKLLYQLLNQ